MIPNQLRVSSSMSRQEEEMMDGRTGSEQDRDHATSRHGQGLKLEPCFQTDSLLPSPSPSLISQLLSHRMAGRSLDPTILFPSCQAVALPQDYECGASPGEGAQALAVPKTYASVSMSCAGDRDQLSDQHLRAKRARVESIIQGMSLPPAPLAFGTSPEATFEHKRERGGKMPWESKRKLKSPQQEQQLRRLQEKFTQVCDSEDAAQTQEGAEKAHPLPGKPGDRADKDKVAATNDPCKVPLWRSIPEVHGQEEDEGRGGACGLPSAARVLSRALKHELAGVTSQVVDSVLNTMWPKGAGHILQQHCSLPVQGPGARKEYFAAGKCRKLLAKPSPMNVLGSLGSARAEGLSGASGKSLGSHAGSFSSKGMQEALTPGHLKKAKLMFFFTRYPSSTLLKTYFLDVQFSRCITSQLIKWFSNFREFYYIQVEKFARQALLEGVTDAGTLRVSRDSELFCALNTHYNKGNSFEVPGRFLEVASLTLREFFSAVRAGKDADPSWKKPIYKIISKLDSDIPEGFKATGCSQELLRS
ncbi:PREDICTED: prospero homeobox protein 2 [Mesitornis unicolor]|uniref:prospero homeobox protein 2 n=1 Tax=Mesitornis unicolor TaxID=54374 RepID=UPI000528BD6A|nr:PREDICTED: prospero homeobox protein 2 [Mesitornis unicolor]